VVLKKVEASARNGGDARVASVERLFRLGAVAAIEGR